MKPQRRMILGGMAVGALGVSGQARAAEVARSLIDRPRLAVGLASAFQSEIALRSAVQLFDLGALGDAPLDPALPSKRRPGLLVLAAKEGPESVRNAARSRWIMAPPAASTLRALALFLCWLFSSWQDTTRPVGRWVMRTAESVVLTD